jgi:hypothetical protein
MRSRNFGFFEMETETGTNNRDSALFYGSTRNHSWVIRRFLNRRWRTLFLVHANGVAVSL